MDNRPIGFLDSGVGGLTVVRELKRQLPHESIVLLVTLLGHRMVQDQRNKSESIPGSWLGSF